MREAYRRQKKRKKGKFLKVTIGIICGILLVGITYGAYIYSSVAKTANVMYNPLKREKSDKRANTVSIKEKQPISILLMGVDERSGDKGRTDTLIVVTINPKTNKMTMFNIPRDTRTVIVGSGKTSKINHAYAYGGVEMTINTVEKFLDIPIDYYIKVNMEALSDMVDALGGITVTNNIQWVDEGYYKQGYLFKKGEIELNGPKTLGFVRMRHLDPRGDFGRNEREREVLQAIISKGSSLSSFTKVDDILSALGNNVKTNLTFDEMKNLQQNYGDARKNVEQFEIKGKGTTIDRIYYLIVSEQERLTVSEKVKKELEIH